MTWNQVRLSFRGVLFFALCFSQSTAWSWAERGHHTLCEVATRLVSNPDLANFLKSRLHLMGHACNIPDIYWRDLGLIAKVGDDAHFMNPENLGYTLESVPLDIDQIISEKEGKYSEVLKRNIVVLKDLGSSWWRYDQFYRRAVLDGKLAKTFEKDASVVFPVGQTNPAKDKFHSAILGMMTNMGIMGHFIGDASQPFHNTNDYDGWNVKHGGIHGYYESLIVSELSITLPGKVYQEAVSIKNGKDRIPEGASPIETIRYVASRSFPELSTILKLDPVIQPSQILTNPNGTLTRIPAQRKLPAEVALDFESTIVHQLALSAVGLAQTWDQIYIEAGKPNLVLYTSYKYPLAPDFVAPDYGLVRKPNSVTSSGKKK